MSMRSEAALTIFVIIFVVTAVNLFSNLFFTRKSITEAVEQDLKLAIDIADGLVGAKIQLLKTNGNSIAENLLKADSAKEMTEIMAEEITKYPEFISLSVFDIKDGVIASYGVPVKSVELQTESRFLKTAVNGETTISSTLYDTETNDLIMHLFVPMKGTMALAATIPGLTFSGYVRAYRLWRNGSIAILDDEGTTIASFNDEYVLKRMNSNKNGKINHVMSNEEFQSRKDFLEQLLSTERGTITFFFDGTEVLCAYKRIGGTGDGWYVIVMVPLNESPGFLVRSDLLLSSLVFLAMGVIAAFFLSKVVTKPFYVINEKAEKIREVNKHTSLLLNAMPLTCHLWNKDLKIFDCNAASVKLFNVKTKEEFLNSFFAFSPEYQPDGMLSSEKAAMLLKKAFEEGKCVNEWMHQFLDGTQLPTEVSLIRVEYENETVVAAYLRDLREQKKMLQSIQENTIKLEVANNAKSDFLASMSHEMRTPLNAIIGLSGLCLEKGGLSQEALLNLEKINDAGETLLSTVNDILDISKIEAGKLELISNEYEIPSLINDTITQCIMRKGDKPIQFELDINENLPTHVYGDELRIKQIFNNLLSNAFKYTRAGTVKLSVSCERQSSGAGNNVWMGIRVEDTGIGIRSEDIDKLFAVYSQVDAKSNCKIEGTGLGLSITKRIVEIMGGEVSVESEYGKGSVFTAKFQQKLISNAVIGPDVVKNLKNFCYSDHRRKKNSQLMRKRMPYARVMVVDDVLTNLDVTKGMMKSYGMTIDCVTSGQEAINAIREGKIRYDAIFMDHMMPEMDGIEAVRIIREEIEGDYAKNIPIIALTANAIIGNEEMFLNNGFQAFLSKPIDVMQLDSILNTWIRNRQSKETLMIAEKKDLFNGTVAEEAQKNLKILKGFFIEGINFAKGLERYSSESAYLEVIRSYHLHTPALLDKIKMFNKGEAGMTMSDYTVLIHGIKGSSYGICADNVGEAAGELEKYARAGDIKTVMEKNVNFMTMVESLLSNLGDLLFETGKGRAGKTPALSPDPSLLARLHVASKEYKASEMEQIMRELESFEYESGGELVGWLRNQMDTLEYNIIRERLEFLMGPQPSTGPKGEVSRVVSDSLYVGIY